MAARKLSTDFALSSIRNYILMLVATIVILASAMIAYLYWHDNLHFKLEEAANHYHLETILHCARIRDELVRVLSSREGRRYDIERPVDQDILPENISNSVYLIGKYTRDISLLHDAYGAGSAWNSRIDPVLRKVSSQIASLGLGPNEAGESGIEHFKKSEGVVLRSLMHSIEQLRRLHTLARDEIKNELIVLETHNEKHLLTILTVAVLLGSLFVFLTLKKIKKLVDQQKQTESILRQSSTVFENAAEGVVITDINARITAVNRAFSKITGYSENEVLGRNPGILKSGRHDSAFYKSMWSSLRQHGEWQGEIWDRRKDGEVFPKWQTINAVRDNSGCLTHYVSVFSDISQLKASEERLHHLAHHDSLTALPNRLLLNARLEHSLQQAQRADNHVAVLFLDLDNFKKINDSLGHSSGDRLLQLVAKRLQLCVRKEDTIARLGGDELVIVLGDLNDACHAETITGTVRDTLSEPFELAGQDVFLSASIGISLYPRDGMDAATLLKNADAAMYMAKSEGRNGYHFYSREQTVRALNSVSLETNLYRALERGELFLHYQPQVSLDNGNIVGMEALLRWQHPESGLVPPSMFIPLAEENGLIEVIGQWVLRTACAQAKAWQNAGLPPFRMAVNLSERQLRQTSIVQDVHDALEDAALDPCYLELEITETSVMKRAEHAARTLDALRELGTAIAIDDFGTGFSSLSYLKRFPVDRLKIDRSFVRDIPQDVNDVALARSIVALGHSLNLSIVAEGVETQQQKETLTAIGCDAMQGFLYSKPGTADDLASLLGSLAHPACVND